MSNRDTYVEPIEAGASRDHTPIVATRLEEPGDTGSAISTSFAFFPPVFAYHLGFFSPLDFLVGNLRSLVAAPSFLLAMSQSPGTCSHRCDAAYAISEVEHECGKGGGIWLE